MQKLNPTRYFPPTCLIREDNFPTVVETYCCTIPHQFSSSVPAKFILSCLLASGLLDRLLDPFATLISASSFFGSGGTVKVKSSTILCERLQSDPETEEAHG